MAIADLSKFYTRVRNMIGGVDECEFSPDDLELLFEDALLEYSRYNPIRTKTTLSVVANQEQYPMPSGYFDIDHSVLLQSGVIGDLTGYGYGLQSAFPTSSVGGALSDLMALDRGQRISDMTRSVIPARTLREQGGQVIVDPTPSATETIYIPVLQIHTPSTVPDFHKRALALLTASMALYDLANKRARLPQSISDATGKVVTRDPEALRQDAGRMEDQFLTMIGARASVAQAN